MRILSRGIEVGQTIEFGELSHIKLNSGHGTSLRAISRGEESEYVLLKETNAVEQEELDFYDGAVILGFTSGQGINGPTCWYCIPKTEYGGDSQ